MHTRFVVDCTLGNLCRWLRLAGFDAVYDRGIPDARQLACACADDECVVLTRSKTVLNNLPSWQVIFIPFNNPLDQVRFVLRELDITPDRQRLLTRCVICNVPLISIEKENVRGRIPDHVYLHQHLFLTCPRCSRVYWRGTHAERFEKLVESWE